MLAVNSYTFAHCKMWKNICYQWSVLNNNKSSSSSRKQNQTKQTTTPTFCDMRKCCSYMWIAVYHDFNLPPPPPINSQSNHGQKCIISWDKFPILIRPANKNRTYCPFFSNKISLVWLKKVDLGTHPWSGATVSVFIVMEFMEPGSNKSSLFAVISSSCT